MEVKSNVKPPTVATFAEMVNKIMSYYGLNRVEFARKFRVEPSQVTRWLDKGQEPFGETRLRFRMEYNKIKDKEPPILKFFA